MTDITPGEILRASAEPAEIVDEVNDDQIVDNTISIDEEVELSAEPEVVEQETDEENPIETITQLAETLEIDPAQFYDLQVPLADGMDPISLGEIKDKYQSYVSEQENFKTEQATFQTEKQAMLNEIEQLRSGAVGSAQNASKEVIEAQGLLQAITAQFESVNWEAAEKENPGEAAVYRQKLNDAYSGAQMQLSQIEQTANKAHQEQRVQYLQNQWGESLKATPEWKDREVYTKERSAIEELAVSYGFDPQEAGQIVDARTLRMLNDFAKLKSGVSGAKANAKLVKKVSSLKPSGLAAMRTKKVTALKKITDRAKRTGDRTDQRAAVSAILSQQR